MSENIERKDNALKRFAKAFFAKVQKAADWVKARFAAVIDSKAKQDITPARKTAGYVLQVPRLLGRAMIYVSSAVLNVVVASALVFGALIAALVGIVVVVITNIMLVAYKVIYGLGLALATPYLSVMDALGDEWSLYAKMWTRKYWKFQNAQQVASGKPAPKVMTDEDLDLDVKDRADALALKLAVETPAPERATPATVTVIEHKASKPAQTPKKGHPTPKQATKRPSRPTPVTA